jgi:arylsulfatase A-like enzyme
MYTKTIIFNSTLVAAVCISAALSPQHQLPLIRPEYDGVYLDQNRPNVVFILTDDQDVHLNSINYMPQVRKHLLDKGTYFNKHYCTTAVCCPSRATLWTGKAAHNTNITDVNPPYGMCTCDSLELSSVRLYAWEALLMPDLAWRVGGYPKFVSQGFHEKYLPVWLQSAGYNTYYTGKLFNVHTVTNYDSPYPPGFTGTVSRQFLPVVDD